MQKLFLSLSIVLAIVLFSVSAHAVSLQSNGQVHTINQNNLKFVTDGDGLVDVYRKGERLASYGFTLQGTINAQQKFLNSWNAAWTWQVLSNTDQNVTVLGTTNWNGLKWEQYWYFSDSEQKFSNFITNNTGFDSTNTNFYYVVRFDGQNTSCINYVDNNNLPKKFCFEEDITKTGNLNNYLRHVHFGKTFFNFNDLIDSGFTFNYLFAGQLVNAHSSLAGNGFIVGVTKNNGLFPNGATAILDPSVIDSSPINTMNYGNPIVKDSSGNYWIVYEDSNTTNTDIFVSKSTDAGETFTAFNLTNSSDFNESFPHIDINSTDGLVITYDKFSGAAATTDVHLATCSAGGCDASTDFIFDINISQCGTGTECSKNFVVFDVNDNAHLVYARGNLQDRNATGYVGLAANWSAERTTNAIGGAPVQNTGIVVSKNGSGEKLSWITSNGAQLNVTKFDGLAWGSNLLLENLGIGTPAEAFAGYDGNFYIVFGKDISGTSSVSRLQFNQCIVTADCSDVGNWSADLNVSTTANVELFSIVQTADLNLHVLASSVVGTAGTIIRDFVRTPNNVWVTSQDNDTNTLFSDSNRTYNPLVRNHVRPGNVESTVSAAPSATNSTLDYLFLSANNSTGIPHVIVFDSNVVRQNNGILASFSVTPPSPIGLDPENNITNINVDFNSTSTEVGLTDVNYTWFVDDINVSTDQNYSRDFNGADADFNIALLVQGQDTDTFYSSQSDTNFLLRTTAQGLDINFTYNNFVNNADVNFGLTSTSDPSTINYVVWGGDDFDFNRTGLQIRFDYNANGVKEVCAIVNSTGDVNGSRCESFTVTRVLVKIPKDEQTSQNLTPFSVSTSDITQQLYSNQSNDLNVFLFFQGGDDQNVLFTTDYNASYYSGHNLIQTSDSQTFQTLQPLLVLISESVSAVFHVINAITQNTIPEVIIESRQGGTLIESTITDSTGDATLSFIVGDTYNLTFIYQGVIVLEQEIRPINTEYFIYLFLEDIITQPQDPETITITFDPSIGQVQEEEDGNFTLTQTITTTKSSITSINIQVDQNGVLFYDTNFSNASGGTFSQDFNASSFTTDDHITVTVTVISSSIGGIQKAQSYFIQFRSDTTFLNAINDLGVNLGQVGRIVLVILSSFVIVGGFAQATRNPHVLSAIVIVWMGAFTALGLNSNYVEWVPVPVFLFAVMGAVALYINRG